MEAESCEPRRFIRVLEACGAGRVVRWCGWGGVRGRGEFTSRADLTDKITSFAIRYNRTAKPWIWAYDARADHARYRARHSRQHPTPATAEPATAQPSHRPRNGNGHHQTEPVKDFCGAAPGPL